VQQVRQESPKMQAAWLVLVGAQMCSVQALVMLRLQNCTKEMDTVTLQVCITDGNKVQGCTILLYICAERFQVARNNA
jgi:hypothetical protein